MADYNNPVKIDEFPLSNSVNSNTKLLIMQANTINNSNTLYLSTLDTIFSNVNIIKTNSITISNNFTPSNSTITVTKGTLWYDNTYLYIATSNNVVKRVSLSNF